MASRQDPLFAALPDLRECAADRAAVTVTLAGAAGKATRMAQGRVVRLDPQHPGAAISGLPARRPCIMLRDVLHLIADYRTTIGAGFAKLRVGGWLVITVPHQFLAERKYRLPSRYASHALRLYTPASLMAEIEESLDPAEYRLRLLQDDDRGYHYAAGIDQRPRGNQHILLAIQRIRRPVWADQLMEGDLPVAAFDPAGRVLAKAEGPVTTHVLFPENGGIDRILVVKLDHRGDFILAGPAFAELRARFPQALITLVCGPWNGGEASASGLFDAILPLDVFGEDTSLKQAPPRDVVSQLFAEMMRGRSFDLAVDLRGFDDTRHLLELVSARHKAGFDRWANFPWLDIALTLPSPTLDGRADQFTCAAAEFSCDEAQRQPGTIGIAPTRPPRLPAMAVYGPYRVLEQGSYELTLDLVSLGRPTHVGIEVAYAQAARRLYRAKTRITAEGCATIRFTLAERAEDVEVRIRQPFWFGPALSFRSARFVRRGALVGVHQSEAMCLLVQLIAMRLKAPFRHDSVTTAS